jgi:hypothetical protein
VNQQNKPNETQREEKRREEKRRGEKRREEQRREEKRSRDVKRPRRMDWMTSGGMFSPSLNRCDSFAILLYVAGWDHDVDKPPSTPLSVSGDG